MKTFFWFVAMVCSVVALDLVLRRVYVPKKVDVFGPVKIVGTLPEGGLGGKLKGKRY